MSASAEHQEEPSHEVTPAYPPTPSVDPRFSIDPSSEAVLLPAQAEEVDNDYFAETTWKLLRQHLVDLRNKTVVPLARELIRLSKLQEPTAPKSTITTSADQRSKTLEVLEKKLSVLNGLREVEEAKRNKLETACEEAETKTADSYGLLGQHWLPAIRHSRFKSLDDVGSAFVNSLGEQVTGKAGDTSEKSPTIIDPASAILAAAALRVPKYYGPEIDPDPSIYGDQQLLEIISNLDKRLFSPLLQTRTIRWISYAVGSILGINLGLSSGVLPAEKWTQILDISKLSAIGGKLQEVALSAGLTVAMSLLGIATTYLLKGIFSSLFVMIGEAYAYRHPSNDSVRKYVEEATKIVPIDVEGESSSTKAEEQPNVDDKSTHKPFNPYQDAKADVETSAQDSAYTVSQGEHTWMSILRDAMPNASSSTNDFYRKSVIGVVLVGSICMFFLLKIYAVVEGNGLLTSAVALKDAQMAKEAGLPAPTQNVDSTITTLAGLFFILPYSLYCCVDGFVRGRDNVYAHLSASWCTLVQVHAVGVIGQTPSNAQRAFRNRNKALLIHQRLIDCQEEINRIDNQIRVVSAEMDSDSTDPSSIPLRQSARQQFAYLQWKLAQKSANEVRDLLLEEDLNRIKQANIELQKKTIDLQQDIADAEVELSKKKVEVAKQQELLVETQIRIDSKQRAAQVDRPAPSQSPPPKNVAQDSPSSSTSGHDQVHQQSAVARFFGDIKDWIVNFFTNEK